MKKLVIFALFAAFFIAIFPFVAEATEKVKYEIVNKSQCGIRVTMIVDGHFSPTFGIKAGEKVGVSISKEISVIFLCDILAGGNHFLLECRSDDSKIVITSKEVKKAVGREVGRRRAHGGYAAEKKALLRRRARSGTPLP